MKKLIFLCAVIFLASGCLVRQYTIYKERVDTNISGNQGYIFGTPPKQEGKKSELDKKREITVFEIEWGPQQIEKIAPVSAPSAVKQKPPSSHDAIDRELRVKEMPLAPSPSAPVEVIPVDKDISERKVASVEKKEKYQFYTVEKDETLQKISEKFYGTTKKWQFLYEENKDILKSPDKVYPGTKIRIPVLD
ncbi:MAG: LysM peptidoglycan-binding domain-containing protein [Candidatus Omnitrophota bacterium]